MWHFLQVGWLSQHFGPKAHRRSPSCGITHLVIKFVALKCSKFQKFQILLILHSHKSIPHFQGGCDKVFLRSNSSNGKLGEELLFGFVFHPGNLGNTTFENVFIFIGTSEKSDSCFIWLPPPPPLGQEKINLSCDFIKIHFCKINWKKS